MVNRHKATLIIYLHPRPSQSYSNIKPRARLEISSLRSSRTSRFNAIYKSDLNEGPQHRRQGPMYPRITHSVCFPLWLHSLLSTLTWPQESQSTHFLSLYTQGVPTERCPCRAIGSHHPIEIIFYASVPQTKFTNRIDSTMPARPITDESAGERKLKVYVGSYLPLHHKTTPIAR